MAALEGLILVNMLVVLSIPRTASTSLAMRLRVGTRGNWSGLIANTPNEAFEMFQREINRRKKTRKRPINIITGHIPWGIHHYLEPMGYEISYVTCSREPLKRLISIWRLTYDQYEGHGLDFGDWLEQKQEHRNVATRMCSGSTLSHLWGGGGGIFKQLVTVPVEPLSGNALQIAKRNLESFALLGVTERYANLQLAIEQIFSWEKLPERKDNRATSFVDYAPTAAERYRVNVLNHEDVLLHEWIEKRAA